MPYEIILFRFVDSDVEAINTAAASAVLLKHGIEMAGDHHYIELHDGLNIELSASGLSEGSLSEIAFSFRGVSNTLHQLIFDLMSATSAVALVVDSESIPLVTSARQEMDLPNGDFTPAIICRSWKDVQVVVEQGYDAWAEWSGIK